MATDAIERARARKAAEETVRKLDLIMKHLGIVDPLAKPEEIPAQEEAAVQKPVVPETDAGAKENQADPDQAPDNAVATAATAAKKDKK